MHSNQNSPTARLLFSCAALFLGISAHAQSDLKAQALLKRADAIRNPAETYKMRIRVESGDSNQEFEVLLSGTDKTLIVTKAPARDRGRNMLMLDRDFYTYVPNLKRSLRLSLAQKMSGQVSNGDIARTRWAGDYSVKIESQDKKETQLYLTGNKKNLTYDKIRLWIENSTARPLRAEFLSLDGKTTLKSAAFENYKNIAGAVRPTLLRIREPGGKESSIHIDSMSVTSLDASLFTTTNMEKAR